MIPAAFDYQRADSADAAIAALADHGDDAKLLAGGHSLVPMMKLRLATPAFVIDVGRVDDLRYVEDAGEHVAVGALTRHRDIETSDVLAEHVPLVAHVASLVGDPAVRHFGTIGGSIAHADPASDLPAAALALGATFVARGPGGEREIAAGDFFTGYFQSVLAADEMLTEIRLPKMGGAGWSYQKFNRRAQDWAIVAVAAVHGNGAGTGGALVNMGSTPVRAAATEAALAAGSSAAEAAALAADGTDPPSDLNGDSRYRKALAEVLTARALTDAGA